MANQPHTNSPAYSVYTILNERCGETLRNLRKSRGETQEQLALALGVEQARISKWERGLQTITYEDWKQIGAHYDRPLKALFIQINGIGNLWDIARHEQGIDDTQT